MLGIPFASGLVLWCQGFDLHPTSAHLSSKSALSSLKFNLSWIIHAQCISDYSIIHQSSQTMLLESNRERRSALHTAPAALLSGAQGEHTPKDSTTQTALCIQRIGWDILLLLSQKISVFGCAVSQKSQSGTNGIRLTVCHKKHLFSKKGNK